MYDMAVIDNGLQNSQKAIGTSSNVAQLYLCKYWDTKDEDLLDNVCILSVLAQLAVDSSKRAFIVGNGENGLNNEIERLRKELKEDGKVLKPTFWKYTSEEFSTKNIESKLKSKDVNWNEYTEKQKREKIKEYKINAINSLKDFNCPVNLVLKEIDKLSKANYTHKVKDVEFIQKIDNKKANRKQATKLEEMVETVNNYVKQISVDSNVTEEELIEYNNLIMEELIEKTKKLKITKDTMILIINRILNTDNVKIKTDKFIQAKMLNILYNYNKEMFLDCFKNC